MNNWDTAGAIASVAVAITAILPIFIRFLFKGIIREAIRFEMTRMIVPWTKKMRKIEQRLQRLEYHVRDRFR